ncbi:hypothetical protein [Cupriavidus pinatubonensis]|uniref:hypothetical protein n=1 Tax=Cupriavidus pinatubonensis TaxID=248026 RepID=UPI003621BD55
MAALLTPAIGVTATAISLGEPLGSRQLPVIALSIGGIALVPIKSKSARRV